MFSVYTSRAASCTHFHSRTTAPDASATNGTYETHVEQAKRAFALKKFELAVEHYADALEIMYDPVFCPAARV